jgi:glycosyltransferase involved in cell wall biosynthesis
LCIPENIPVISVVHGTWTEFIYRNTNKLETNGEQDIMWHRKNLKTVAVSNSAAKYLLIHHGVKADKIILNGVDTEIFKPLNLKRQKGMKPVVIHCARDYNKDSQGKFQKIQDLLCCSFNFIFLHNEEEGKEYFKYNQADIALQCSNYEGNSYFMLEAMACGLPVVASETGLFEDTNFTGYKIGEILPYTASAENYADAILQACFNIDHINTRKWILENATFDIWAKQWKDFLRENYEIK